MSEPVWITANRANWDERVAVHLAPVGYDLADLRKGHGKLCAIVEPELPLVSNKRVLHLQCHFGKDTLTLAQRGAEVVGLDFSPPAIAAARTLTAELGLAASARFVLADLYDAPAVVSEPAGFDLVYVTWGALCWLPDIRRWAEIVAHFLKPGGSIYLAEGHPAAMVLDDEVPQANGDPGFFVPYFHSEPLVGRVVTALIAAGLRLDWLHEHDAITWQLFKCLTESPDGLYRWPHKKWLPLSYSLQATLLVASRQNGRL
jgi:SAM-dependent methyltransferase